MIIEERGVVASGLLLIAILVANPSRAVDVDEYFPLAKGREWRYEVQKTRTYTLPDRKTSQNIVGTSVERITGLSGEVTYDVPAYVLIQETEETNQSTKRVVEGVTETHISSEPTQILMHSQRVQGVPGMDSQVTIFNPPVALLKLPLPEAEEPFPSIVESKGMTFDSRPYAKGSETIETTAGTFEDCLRISARGPVTGELPGQQALELLEGSIEETLWFAKGIGLVKQVQVLRMRVDLGNQQQLETLEEKTKLLTAFRE